MVWGLREIAFFGTLGDLGTFDTFGPPAGGFGTFFIAFFLGDDFFEDRGFAGCFLTANFHRPHFHNDANLSE
jgi:hypothetical protein